MTPLRFTRSGASANLDFYRSNRPEEIYVEVLIDTVERSGSTLRRRSLPLYRIIIMQHDGHRWTDTRFTYCPKSKIAGIHLPDRTLTKLVREKLES